MGCCTNSGELTVSLTREDASTAVTLRGVARYSDSTALAVGDDGTIVIRGINQDGWVSQESGVAEDLYSIAIPDGDDGPAFVVGTNGTILRGPRADGPWARLESGVSANLYAVAFLRESDDVVAVGDGVVLTGLEPWNVWTSGQLPTGTGKLLAVDSVSVAELDAPAYWEILAVGEGGRGVYSVDSGSSWESIAFDTEANLVAVHANPSTFMVFADDGTMWTQRGGSVAAGFRAEDSEASIVNGVARNGLWLALADGTVGRPGEESLLIHGEAGQFERLLAIDGNSMEAIAVGEHGTIVRAVATWETCP